MIKLPVTLETKAAMFSKDRVELLNRVTGFAL